MSKDLGRINDISLSPNFKLYEFVSPDTGTAMVHPDLLTGLEFLRVIFKRTIIVTSGYRTVEHNSKVGGAKNSRHITGCAADVIIKGVAHGRFKDMCKVVGFDEIIYYGETDHWHLSVDPNNSLASHRR